VCIRGPDLTVDFRNFSAIIGCAHFRQSLFLFGSLVEGRDFEKEATSRAFQFRCAEGRKALLRGASQGRCRCPPSKNFQRPWALCRPARPLDQRWHLRLRFQRLICAPRFRRSLFSKPTEQVGHPALDFSAAEVGTADSKSHASLPARQRLSARRLTNQAAPADPASPEASFT